MLKFVKYAFRVYIGVILWLNLIICAIAGGVIGNTFSGWGNSYTELGIVIGLVVGALSNIIGGGFIATILNIDENLEQLKNLTIASNVKGTAFIESNLEYTENDGKITITGYRGLLTGVMVIPAEINNVLVTAIGKKAFEGKQLTSITIPDNITVIGNSAFENNTLTDITIGNGVTNIGNFAFLKNQLTNVTVPDSTSFIGQGAFQNNRLTNVTVPSHAHIEWGVFDPGVKIINRA